MDLAAFRASLDGAAPPQGLSTPLQALWWLAKGEWDKAHVLTQNDDGADAAWVHAHLHRVEGDLGNARYWYDRAGRPPASNDLPAEWSTIARILLATG